MSEFLATDRLDGEAPTIEGRLADIIENDGGAIVQISEYKLSDSDRALVVKALRAAAQRSEVLTGDARLPPVARIEMVQSPDGYEIPATPIFRVMVDKYCIDFETETAAGNVRNAILALGAAQAAPDPQIALESERAEGWKRLAYNVADEISNLWVCTGCGTRKSMEQIKGETPDAIACCPERKMAPPVPSASRGTEA